MTNNTLRRKICFITGTRADYGIMSRLMHELKQNPNVELQIIATNMHLSALHGMTVNEIENDGFTISKRVEMGTDSESPGAIVRSMGVEMAGMADAFEELKPDIIVILGDRYEMLVAASAALIFSIPVVHLYGGETTEGAFDDSIRHAITKLSRLHFSSTELYRERIIKMGENPSDVHYVGALGADNIDNMPIMSLEDLEKSLNFNLHPAYILATFHPVTLERGQAKQQIDSFLDALDSFTDRFKILFTLPNSDTEGELIAERIVEWAGQYPDTVLPINSLGRARYYSALKYASLVAGNSSSGLTEAPSMGIPTVDIGNRQKGRARGCTIIHCEPKPQEIKKAIEKALSPEFMSMCQKKHDNPYRKANTMENILRVLTETPLPLSPFKPFHDN